MAPTHSIAFCNNRGGVGKTFMAFQTACETARARPDKKVLVLDFSLYSDITALLLGGSAREGFGAPMKGLQVTVENTTEDTRAEGLIRTYERALPVIAAYRRGLGGEHERPDFCADAPTLARANAAPKCVRVLRRPARARARAPTDRSARPRARRSDALLT